MTGPALLVLQPGLFTTTQDLGRPGFRAWGVPPAGAFDTAAHALANALVGNHPNQTTLEFTLLGGRFRALQSLALAIAGAPFNASIEAPGQNPRPLKHPGSFTLKPDQILNLGACPTAARAYLAVSGGWIVPARLQSTSSETPLQPAQILHANPGAIPTRSLHSASTQSPQILRILPGPETSQTSSTSWKNETYIVANESDRVGIRLNGPPIDSKPNPNRLSAPLAPGAVQLAGGQLILLGVAGGTLGGYPHIAQIATVDLVRLAQLRPADHIRFEPISIPQARQQFRDAQIAQTALCLRVRASLAC